LVKNLDFYKNFFTLLFMNLKNIADVLTLDFSPGTWAVQSENMIVRNTDQLALFLREGGYDNRGKIRISFSRPRDAKGQYVSLWEKSPANGAVSDPSINVSADKTSEQIARDIVRRLLPEAERVFALATETVNSHNKFETDKVEAIKLVAFHCGTRPERHYQTDELNGEVDPYKGAGLESFKANGYGKFKVSGKDCISLELNSMNLDVALEIADALHAIFRERADNDPAIKRIEEEAKRYVTNSRTGLHYSK
jgi:hypothetical protein